MRLALMAVLLMSVTAGLAPAQAQQTGAACQGRNVLGVSRTYAIDTTRGPRYGLQQYREFPFLNDGEVVLTFDDGPLRPYTKPVIEALAAHCTRATFFMVGRMAAADPEMVREIVRRGHTVGTHTFTHRNLRTAGFPNARHEIELAFSTVNKAAGTQIAPFFRFPYLADSKAVMAYLQTRNIGMFSIEVDSNDYRTQSPDVVHRNVMSQLMAQKKGIILFHDIQPSTAGALKRLLDELAQRNFKVVHLVSKTQLQTLPEFDALADRELGRRKQIATAQPLAPRSMVWTASPPPPGGQAAAQQAAPAPSQPAAARPGSYPVPPAPMLPPAGSQVQDATPVAAPPSVERPARNRSGEDASWQRKAFGTN